MSKLIVETEMNGIPECCGLCDPLFAAVCAIKHDYTIDKMMLRVGRPSWCPIKGVLPEHHGRLGDLDALPEFDPCGEYTAFHFINAIENAPTIVPATERSET